MFESATQGSSSFSMYYIYSLSFEFYRFSGLSRNQMDKKSISLMVLLVKEDEIN